MSEAFEKWSKTEMLPAECDDERVMVGMRLCWNAAMEHAAKIANSHWLGDGAYLMSGRRSIYAEDIATMIRKEVHGE